MELPAPRSGTLRNLFVRHNVSGGNGNNVTYTVTVNGVATAITVMLATGAVGQASDTTHTLAISAGDRIGLMVVKAASIGGGSVDVVVTLELA
jgi:hypothetical protein